MYLPGRAEEEAETDGELQKFGKDSRLRAETVLMLIRIK